MLDAELYDKPKGPVAKAASIQAPTLAIQPGLADTRYLSV